MSKINSLNISEGSARTTKMFVNQLIIAKGSTNEVLSGSILASRLGFMAKEDLVVVREKTGEIVKMLRSLISSLENQN
jgi:four helix bundle protein